MKRREDDYGLWSNIQHFMFLTGWSQSYIAKLMYPYTEGIELKQLTHSLTLMLFRRQKRWKYSAAFAEAFGLPEQECLMEDMRACSTVQALHRHYGFNRQEVVKRSEQRFDKKWIALPRAVQTQRFLLLLEEVENDLAKLMKPTVVIRPNNKSMGGISNEDLRKSLEAFERQPGRNFLTEGKGSSLADRWPWLVSNLKKDKPE